MTIWATPDPVFSQAMCRVWNDYAHETFGAHPERMVAVGAIAPGDLEGAIAEVRRVAEAYLPWTALYVSFSFCAFQLDGIFIGATRTRAMRNAAVMSTGVFLLSSWPLSQWLGNHGLWLSFVVFVLARAVALGLHYPALRRSAVA